MNNNIRIWFERHFWNFTGDPFEVNNLKKNSLIKNLETWDLKIGIVDANTKIKRTFKIQR